MGLLIDGIWHDQGYDTGKTKGHFVRQTSTFRNWIKADQTTEFPAASGRYHLYVSLACPWAHRTLIMRKLKHLESIISLSIVDPLMAEHGWEFSDNKDCIPDSLYNFRYLHQLYTKAKANYTGRVTVPVLWDKKNHCMINNESADIMRMFNGEFNALTKQQANYYPAALADDIDQINEHIYHHINNGVYRCGFATTQAAYEQAYDELFTELAVVEQRLSQHPYLAGHCVTEADWRLFTTLIRFDAVYYSHFKCNKKRLIDYPHISRYLTALYNTPGIAETVNLAHIKNHYYKSHKTINPTGIVPKGPEHPFIAKPV